MKKMVEQVQEFQKQATKDEVQQVEIWNPNR